MLLEAWCSVRKRIRGAALIIAGTGNPEHVDRLKGWIDADHRRDVSFVGLVEGEERRRLLVESTTVVLPSYSENYGMVVAQALACETPVVTTTGTPWRELTDHRCGWQVEPRADAISKALVEALSLDPVERAEMGRRGRQLVEDRHSIKAAATRMTQCYEWVLGRRDTPECVELI
jgi:glycosyltransferase involved in cell wall biosynthesis